MPDALYNALLLAMWIPLALRYHRRRRFDAALFALAAVAAPVLAVVLGGGGFAALRLLCEAVFVELPLFALALAVLARRASPRLAVGAGLCALALVAIGLDAFVLEPHALQVHHVAVASPRLRRPLRIAVVSDIQMDRFGPYERAALDAVMAQHADVILMSGDYIQADDADHDRAIRAALVAYLRAIHFGAPLGVYAVQGNVEPHDWPSIFATLPVTTFASSGTVARDAFDLTGLTLADSFDRALRVERSPRFHIVLGHGPDFALGDVRADLLVAGHTHGGQVRLPLIGPLMTLSHVPRAWAAGATALPGGRTLLVSRGIGMERHEAPRLRFLCRPEIVVIDATPSAWSGGFKGMARIDAGEQSRRNAAVEKRGGSSGLPGGATQFYIPNLTVGHIAKHAFSPR